MQQYVSVGSSIVNSIILGYTNSTQITFTIRTPVILAIGGINRMFGLQQYHPDTRLLRYAYILRCIDLYRNI